MRCIYCGCPDTGVVDSRHVDQGNTIRRRRQCRCCGKRFTTFEKTERLPVRILKRNGQEEAFDADKLRQSIRNACPKRLQQTEWPEEVVKKVEQALCSSGRDVVTTCDIAELVFRDLMTSEPMVFLRYASMQFEDCSVEEFMHRLMGIAASQEKNEEF